MAEEKNNVEEEIQEIDIVPSSDYEYLMSAVNAFECVDGIDAMTADNKRQIARIKKKCLRIIDFIIGNMHDELFDETKDDENS